MIKRSIRTEIGKIIKRRNRATGWVQSLALAPLVSVIPVHVAVAQDSPGALSLDEIIVTARRRDESLQDVPISVSAVTDETLRDLDVRRLEDLTEIVAGLELEDDPLAPNARMRGVVFDAFSSGNNPTVEFYLNDAPIVSIGAMQSMFDMGMIEVLRGPQGTLRGRASPSGSITMRTRRPELDRFGGHIDLTYSDLNSENINGAVNIPLIEDMLAVRVAGFIEENRQNHVESIRTGEEARLKSDGWRVSVRFEPLENLSINAMYQELQTDRYNFDAHESANLMDPSLPPSPFPLEADDYKSLSRFPSTFTQPQDRVGLEMEWQLGKVTLNYAGAISNFDSERRNGGDGVGFFAEGYPSELEWIGQSVDGTSDAKNHELRATVNVNDDMTFVVGTMYQDLANRNDVTQNTILFLRGTAPQNFFRRVETGILSAGGSEEKSVFANLNYRITDATELSLGSRYIDHEVFNDVTIPAQGRIIADYEDDFSATIFTASLAHAFSEDVMTYVTIGSSWRPGVSAIGHFSTTRTQREEEHLQLDPEESISYEVGFKTEWLDSRLRVNGAVFYQDFDNYPFRGPSVAYVSTDGDGLESVDNFNFVTAVPLEAFGFELDASYQATDRWNMSATYAWSQGFFEGDVACNDYFPNDGIPDTSTGNPPLTVEQIRGATGGENLSECSVEERMHEDSIWTANLRTEYEFPVLETLAGYVRASFNVRGHTYQDNNDRPTHAIVNLFAGLQGADQQWEIGGYARNLLDRQFRSRADNPAQTTIRDLARGNVTIVSPWRTVSLSSPREIGVQASYRF